MMVEQPLIVTGVDAVLSWTLTFPRDVTLIIVALLTAAVLLCLRRLLASQDRLAVIHQDERRCRELIADAKSRGDAEAVRRHRHVRQRVSGERLRAEFLPALVGILPMLLIVTWGHSRLAWLPLRSGEAFLFSATFPASSIEELVHLVPVEGITSKSGWMRIVQPSRHDRETVGVATWSLRSEESPPVKSSSVTSLPVEERLPSFVLTLRHRGRTIRHPLHIESITASADVLSGHQTTVTEIEHAGEIVTRVGLSPYRPFGFLPGVSEMGMPPWLCGFVLLTLIAYLVGKRLFRLP